MDHLRWLDKVVMYRIEPIAVKTPTVNDNFCKPDTIRKKISSKNILDFLSLIFYQFVGYINSNMASTIFQMNLHYFYSYFTGREACNCNGRYLRKRWLILSRKCHKFNSHILKQRCLWNSPHVHTTWFVLWHENSHPFDEQSSFWKGFYSFSKIS